MAKLGVNVAVIPPAGLQAATWLDSTSMFHEYVVMETQATGADPVAVGSSNPLPTQFLTAQSIIGNIGAGGPDSGFGVKISGVYNSSAPSLTSGWRGDLQLDSSGNVKVNISAGGGSGGTASTIGAAYPSLATAVGAQSASGALLAALNVDGSGNLKVNVAAGSLQAVTDNSSAFSSGSTQAIPLAYAFNDSASAVTSGFMGIPRITAARQMRVVVDAATNGGAAPYSLISAATTNATLVKSSAGQIAALVVGNSGAGAAYMKLYNSGTIPTAGSGTPVWRVMVPGNTAGAGAVIPIPPGLVFSSGIGFTITGAYADNDTTAVLAGQVLANVAYQ